MSWALLDDNFATNPKVMLAVQKHALARDLYVCGLCYCRKYLTGGVIPKSVLKGIGFMGNERKAADALVATGLWLAIEGGYQIHDYALQYDDESDKQKKDDKSAKRREAGRKGGLTRAANAQANGKQTPKQIDKQTPSNEQAHRTGVVWSGQVSAVDSSEDRRVAIVRSVVSAIPENLRVDAGDFHRAVESGLSRAGLSVRREVEVPGPESGRVGRIDLVVSGDPMIAIELDNRTGRAKSIQKLLAFDGLRLLVLRDGYEQAPQGIPGITTISCDPLPASLSGRVDRTTPTADVEWAQFVAAYPQDGRVVTLLAERMFFDARESGVTLAAMLEALENHKASARWADGKIPNIQTWLEGRRWLQRLPPPKPSGGGRTGAAPVGKYDGIEVQ